MRNSIRCTDRLHGVSGLGWALALCLALASCSQAVSLGDEPPDTVEITGTPTWDNGIRALMDLKCAVCHTQPLPAVAPGNTPRDMNLAQQDRSGTTRGALQSVDFIQAGLLTTDIAVFPRMPPEFATPLAASEETALQDWALATPPPDIGGSTAAADGLVLYAAHCQGCHEVRGSGGPYSAIAGDDAAVIKDAIAFGIINVPLMASWPYLSGLSASDVQAIANYLETP
ncbi:MAG TPA: cytochrome c [bacterium]